MKLVYQLDKIVNKILQLIVVIMLSVMSVVVFAGYFQDHTYVYSVE